MKYVATTYTMFHGNARQYIAEIAKKAAKQNSKKGAFALPYLYPLARDIPTDNAKKYSRAYQQKFRRKGVPFPMDCEPRLLEEALFFHNLARRHNMVFEVARLIRDTAKYQNIVTPDMYLLLLQLIRDERDRRLVKSAVSVYIELQQQKPEISPEDRNLAASLLLDIYDNCRNITDLLLLKIAYENYMSKNVTDPALEARYIGAFIKVYLNTNQYTRAVDLFDQGASDLADNGMPVGELLHLLPTKCILDAMCAAQDADMLTKWLETVLDADPAFVDYALWSEILSLGLSLNHYGLVKLIYSKVIMRGLGEISLDEIMFSNKAKELEEKSSVLASLSEKTLTSILHTLASNGDVNLTLNLIEWHYVHKKLRGEKALTKELCLDIIFSYCYHNEEARSDAEDVTVINALGAIDNFTNKLELELSYRDVCDAMSYRFTRYKAPDSNVDAAKLKGYLAFKKAQEFEEETNNKPRKISSSKIHSSEKGNILMNSEVLDAFVRSTATHIVQNNYNAQTLHIFVNCLLHHIMKYQNATGMVVALLAMHQVNPKMASEWLTRELFDLILKTISRSPAGKFLGYDVFQYMLKKGMVLTQGNFEDLIFSALHGEKDSQLLDFYLAKSQSQGIKLSENCRRKLDSSSLLQSPDNISDPIIYSDREKIDRLRFYQMDKRDSGYLNLILNGDETKLLAEHS